MLRGCVGMGHKGISPHLPLVLVLTDPILGTFHPFNPETLPRSLGTDTVVRIENLEARMRRDRLEERDE